MGLSAMGNAPDFDQALRYANIMGQSHFLPQSAWTGEGNLNSLGLIDGDPSGTITAAGNSASQVAGAVGDLISTIRSGGKKKKSTTPTTHPMLQQQQMPMQDGSHPDMSKWLIYGGLAIGAVVILMVVMKKKKKNDHGD